MRLLLLTTEFPPGPGGIGTHAHALADGLTSLGADVHVLARQDYADEGEVAQFNAAQRFGVLPLPSAAGSPLTVARRWRQVSRLVHDLAPGALVASGSRAVWLGAAVARRTGVPLVAIGHGTEFSFPSAFARGVTRWAYASAATVVCVSRFTERVMLDRGIRPPGRTVIPNGADPTRFRRLPELDRCAVRSRLGLPPDARLLTTVGNVTDRKGQDVVVRALPFLLRDEPHVHYVAAGLPTRAVEFMALARELGVAEHVHFLGRTPADELVELLNACDVFVMTSRMTADGDFEGYGIAVIEAALCGAPAVVSRDSGLAEAIEDGRTGFGVPQEDPEATAMAIGRLLADEPLRRRFADAAHRRAVAEQTWPCRVAEYHRLLRDVTRGRRTSDALNPVRVGSGA